MKKSLFFAATALGLLLTSVGFAQTATPEINHRQRSEQRRIRQGERSGALTRPEAKHLEAREADIRQDKRLAKVDGVVTPAERRGLRRDENQASRAIYRQKHDLQTRRSR